MRHELDDYYNSTISEIDKYQNDFDESKLAYSAIFDSLGSYDFESIYKLYWDDCISDEKLFNKLIYYIKSYYLEKYDLDIDMITDDTDKVVEFFKFTEIKLPKVLSEFSEEKNIYELDKIKSNELLKIIKDEDMKEIYSNFDKDTFMSIMSDKFLVSLSM